MRSTPELQKMLSRTKAHWEFIFACRCTVVWQEYREHKAIFYSELALYSWYDLSKGAKKVRYIRALCICLYSTQFFFSLFKKDFLQQKSTFISLG